MSPEQAANFLQTLYIPVRAGLTVDEMSELADVVRQVQIENFVGESDENNVPWAPRTRSYSHPILRKTLAMMEAATVEGKPGAIEVHEVIGGRQRLVMGIDGSEIPYAKDHQEGNPERNLPRRQFYFIRGRDRARLRMPVKKVLYRIVLNHVKRNLRSA